MKCARARASDDEGGRETETNGRGGDSMERKRREGWVDRARRGKGDEGDAGGWED